MKLDSDGTFDDPEIARTVGATGSGEPGARRDADSGAAVLSGSRYQVRHLHAKGGMGQVWLAHDPDIGRDVALKILHGDLAAGEVVRARFLAEARVTGQLEHPGVVPVYELGPADATGARYYTMRFLHGRTLSAAIDEYHAKRPKGAAGRTELRALLGAFVTVCNTVAYAHARGVIHRDLKGENIMLGDFGEVMVLDWGIAKVGGDSTTPEPMIAHDGPATRTVQGRALGTPAYMAPEQAAGLHDQVDARSDVYSLGAVLYEILVGETPFTADTLVALLTLVIYEDPVPPRRRVSDVPRPLDAICMKALARVPEARYPSAEALRRDVERFLADEPVSVLRESLHTRIARWGRQHRTLATGLVALVATAAVALGVSTILLQRAHQQTAIQREAAERNFAAAREAVDTYLTAVSDEQLLREPGMQPLRRRLLGQALDYYQRFATEHEYAHDPTLRRDLAEAHRRVGEVVAEIGTAAEAEASLARAVALYEELDRGQPGDEALAHGRARALLALGRVRQDEPELARADVESAIALCEELEQRQPDVLEYRHCVARGHHQLASILFLTSPQEAMAAHRRAVALLEETLTRSSANSETRRLLVLAAASMSAAASWLGDSTTAEEVLIRTIPEARRLVEEEPELALPRRGLARSLLSLGLSQFGVGRFAAAAANVEEALELMEALARANPRVGEYQRTRASLLGRLGELEVEIGRMARAEAHLDEAIRAGEEQNGREPPSVGSDLDLAWRYAVRGRVALDLGRGAEAVSWLDKALTRIGLVEGRAPDPELIRIQRLDTEVLLVLARREAGERSAPETVDALREIAAEWARIQAQDLEDTSLRDSRARVDVAVAEAELVAGRSAEARETADRVIAALDAAAAVEPARDLITLSIHMKALAVRAEALAQTGDRAGALVAARRALEEARKLVQVDAAHQFAQARECVRVARLLGQSDEADGLHGEAAAALEQAIAAGFDNAHWLRPDGPLAGLPGDALARLGSARTEN